jgi:hypothetical protein
VGKVARREKRGATHGTEPNQNQAEGEGEPPDFKSFYIAIFVRPGVPRGIPMRKKRQPQPPRAAHPSLATLRPRGWPRPRALATGPPGVGSPPAPASELARHLAPRPRLRFSATPPINAPRAAPTLAAAASSSSSRPPVDMAGVSGKRRSPSGDGMFAPRPQLVTRKRRSGGRVRRPPATRPVSVSELTDSPYHLPVGPWLGSAPPYILMMISAKAVVGRGGGEVRWAGGPEEGDFPSSSCSQLRLIAIEMLAVVDIFS